MATLIAPSPVDLAQETYLFDLVMSSLHKSGHGCGNCRTPFGRSALYCRNNPLQTDTAALVAAYGVREGLGGRTKLGPQTGAQRERESDGRE